MIFSCLAALNNKSSVKLEKLLAKIKERIASACGTPPGSLVVIKEYLCSFNTAANKRIWVLLPTASAPSKQIKISTSL